MKTIEQVILQNLLQKDSYLRKVIPYLKVEYFESEYRVVFLSIADHVAKYNTMPGADALKIAIAECKKGTEGERVKAIQLADQLFEPISGMNDDWLMDETEKWCQNRAITIAIFKSADIIQGRDAKLERGAIPSLLQDALAVTFDPSVGHDFFADSKERYDFYIGKGVTVKKIPFRLELLNRATSGGVETKSLNMILGGTGGGKSLMMCSLCADYLRDGVDCLYVSCEMSELKVAQRIEANLLDENMADLKELGQYTHQQMLDRISSEVPGRLVIKEFPTGTATADHVRALLNELKLKKQFVPTVIFLDYLNICASTRYRADNSYQYSKGIAEEMRGLAMERNVAMWSATQANREGLEKSDLDIQNTSESVGVPFTADFMISIFANEKMRQSGMMSIRQATKNRYADANAPDLKTMLVGCNTGKMTLFNLDSDD